MAENRTNFPLIDKFHFFRLLRVYVHAIAVRTENESTAIAFFYAVLAGLIVLSFSGK